MLMPTIRPKKEALRVDTSRHLVTLCEPHGAPKEPVTMGKTCRKGMWHDEQAAMAVPLLTQWQRKLVAERNKVIRKAK